MLLDGPIGTALWLPLDKIAAAALTHPAAVRAIHARWLADGAQALLSASFAVPMLLAQNKANAEAVFRAALACAANPTAPVWISLGPPAGGADDAAIAETALTWAAHAAREGRAKGVWLETCRVEDGQWLSAASEICARHKVEYVVTFAAHAQAARDLLPGQPQARAVGLNCGLRLFTDEDAEALAAARLPTGQKRVFKPATALGGERLSPARVAALAHASRADWVGVCCGGTSEHLAALSSFREEWR